MRNYDEQLKIDITGGGSFYMLPRALFTMDSLQACGNDVTVNIICTEKPQSHPTTVYDEFIAEPLPKEWTSWKDKLIWGRNYTHVDPNDEEKTTRMWICPVTLFVLGRYPKYIYIRKTTI